MPEPTQAPLANPVLPSITGIPFAMSPLERDAAQAPAQPASRGAEPPPGSPPSNTYDHDSARQLEAARARDLGQRQPQPAQDQQQDQARQDDPPREGEPLLKPRMGRQARRSNDWETLRSRAEQAEAELARVRGTQPASQNAPDFDITKLAPDTLAKHPDYARLKQERDTFYEEIKHVRVEADPEFRAKYEARESSILNAVKRVSGKAAEEIVEIFKDRDPDRRMAAIADRIKDFGDGSKAQIIAAASQMNALDIEREIEVGTRKATWEQTQASRQASQASAFEAKLGKMNGEFENVWQEACHPETGVPFLLDDRIKSAVLPDAKRIFSGESDARSLAKASLNAALLPHVIQTAQAAFKEIERLNNALGTYSSTWPTDDGGSLGNDAPASAPPINPAGYDSRFGSGIEQARQADLRGKQWGR